MAENASDPA
jgi:uncharacterized protein (TIGR00730 family)